MYENYEAELDRAYGPLGSFAYFRLLKAEILRERLAPREDAPVRILDVGAGDGALLSMLGPGFDAVALEPDAEMIAQRVVTGEGGVFVAASGAALPLGDETVDAVVASCVFHHMERDDVDRCLRDSLRVLRPGGRLFVFEHNTFNLAVMLFLKLFVSIDRDARFIGSHELGRRVAAAGFASVSWRYFCFLPGFLAPFRKVERLLGWLPLGGQYVLEARKDG